MKTDDLDQGIIFYYCLPKEFDPTKQIIRPDPYKLVFEEKDAFLEADEYYVAKLVLTKYQALDILRIGYKDHSWNFCLRCLTLIKKTKIRDNEHGTS